VTPRASLLILALVLQALPISAAAPLGDGQRDFDFQYGTWRVHVLRLSHPLSRSKTWVAYDGTHVVSKVWNGLANIGVLEIDGAAGHLEGQSLRLYNPQTHQWSFTFANSNAGTMGPPMIGELRDGRGVFFSQDTYAGRSVLVRSISSAITPTSYRDEYAFSPDGGSTWETNWIADYTLVNRNESGSSSSTLASSDVHQHDFDFEWGSWEAHLRRRLHPLTGSNVWVTYAGPSVVRKIWNGRANLGEIDLVGSAGRIVGLSLRLYDPGAHQWSISFARPGDGSLESPPTVGGFKHGRGEFFDQETLNGRAILCRFVFSDITPKRYHFEQSFSDDGGATWEVNWVADFSRVPSALR
jgi:hypothetical protein